MIELDYSLVIEATDEPEYFGFYSPELEGFTGIGRSVQDCLDRARRGMREHVAVLREHGLPVPSRNLAPEVVIRSPEHPGYEV